VRITESYYCKHVWHLHWWIQQMNGNVTDSELDFWGWPAFAVFVHNLYSQLTLLCMMLQNGLVWHNYSLNLDYVFLFTSPLITFCVSHRRCEVYSGHARLSVYLWLAAFPHYYADPDVTWVMVGVSPNCALLGGFAIGARVSLPW